MESYQRVLGIIFFLFCFGYGLYISMAAMRNWKSFINSPKRIDLIKVFGDFGRVLYMIIGIFLALVSVLMVLKIFDLGPFAFKK